MTDAKRTHKTARDLKESASRLKIRTKLLLLIIVSGIFCMLLFRFLWLQKWGVWTLLLDEFPVRLDILPRADDDFFDKLAEEAPKYNIPASEHDKEAVEAMAPFFDLADDYTSLYIYGLEDGLFRAGKMPKIMDNGPFHVFFNMGYNWTEGAGEQLFNFPLQFKNGYASIHMAFYHSSCFIFPYFIFCLALCIFLFLSVIVYFVSRKIKSIVCLKDTILRMSSGDLTTAVPCMGKDELGILSQELDKLRCTLRDNFRQEQELHKSNQELVTALSHDLRTPLTILKGYLEILRLGQNVQMQAEYVKRCLQKTDDIQEMTDRMFEYALVYEDAGHQPETAASLCIPAEFVWDSLKEHEDFLQLAGFQTAHHFPASPDSGLWITADTTMLKRVFNNLFSNIIKYADKKETVSIFADADEYLTIVLENHIKTERDQIESTQIGLKSVKKMMALMDGEIDLHTEDRCFTARLRFPCHSLDCETLQLPIDEEQT